MKTNKNLYIVGISIGFLILLSTTMFALGVGSLYHEDNPLKISAGETKDLKFRLQNIPGTEDITIRANILKGSEIFKITDPSEEYFVPIGGTVYSYAEVSIPDDAKIGEVYDVKLGFATVTDSESGSFSLGSSIGKSFSVVIVPKIEEKEEIIQTAPEITISTTTYIVFGTVIILILAVVIWLILKRRKNKENVVQPFPQTQQTN